jgi:hypothetical protein
VLVLSEAMLVSARRGYAPVSSLRSAIRSFGKKVLPEGYRSMLGVETWYFLSSGSPIKRKGASPTLLHCSTVNFLASTDSPAGLTQPLNESGV